MNTTSINLDVFEPSHRSGLLFSMYEGLQTGGSFRISTNGDLELIKNQFLDARLANLKFELLKSEDGLSRAEIKKVKDSKVGCCGMCGG
jgi:uncharacterized protein (DUF2249 family)